MLAFILVLAVQGRAVEDASILPLRYLARHQGDDGSWGARPEPCRCPVDAKAEPPAIGTLLRALADDDPASRDEAERRLRALGEAALPGLREAAKDPDPEVRARGAALLGRLDRAAAGADDAELTALALLAFLSSGYSHHSKETRDGICFGETVKKAIRWLIARQIAAGAFEATDGVADAIGALALSEAYGLSGSILFKAEAQAGVNRTAQWTPRDTRGRIWKGMALKSAELSGLTVSRESAHENLRGLTERDPLGIAGYGLIARFVQRGNVDPRMADLRTLDPAELEVETLYVATLAMFHYDGPSGSLWKRWNVPFKERLRTGGAFAKDACERGSWEGRGFRGRLRGTALQEMMYQGSSAYRTVLIGK